MKGAGMLIISLGGVNCVVPESIHTSPRKVIGNCLGEGG